MSDHDLQQQAPAAATRHAVRIDAEPDPSTSRALWLVKWLLLVPHYVVLALLWTAFAVTTIMAFFAILVTGRYPAVLFDFNVGVLRWSWRVSYYGYGALATDRYPPFSLHDVADYPAHLDVERPGELSRLQALTKWWLLAIPHYLVLGLLLGGATGYDSARGDDTWLAGPGLIGLLVLVAGVLLLFTGRYPRPLFDLLVGLNRWVQRVVGYAALMTDRYPPFALDQGGPEPDARTLAAGTGPGTGIVASSPTAGPTPGVAPSHSSGWTAGRAVTLVAGSVLLLMAVGLVGAAATTAWVDRQERSDGFVLSDDVDVESAQVAVTSTTLRWHTEVPGDQLPARLLGDTRLVADAQGGQELFVGVGPTAAVDDFLDGVGHDVVVAVRDDRAVLRTQPGGSDASRPVDQDFWAASGSGTGAVTVTWQPTNGDWTWVVMNTDASAGVEADVRVGAELPELGTLAGVLGGLALITALLGLALVATGVVLASRERRAQP